MKIAHFGIFAPHASGQYGTIKDLIFAERAIGIDAQFIDCGTDDKDTVRVGLQDGEIITQSLAWAYGADVLIRHSRIPEELYKKPVVLAIHGRPENSFRLEFDGKSPIISTIRKEIHERKYKAVFTFWKEHVHYWQHIYGVPINHVPPPVHLNNYPMEGEKHNFGKHKAGLNLIITDMWREDYTPFNLIFAAQYFQNHYRKDTKLHIYGMPTKKCGFLANLQSKGVLGEVSGVVGWLPKVYRAADILLTPHLIATRTIREAMMFGLPVVAATGNPYTQFTAEPRDYKQFAKAINDCVIANQSRQEIRAEGERLFDSRNTAIAVKQICFNVLNLWSAMSITKDDWEVLKGFISGNKIQNVTEFGTGFSTKLMKELGVGIKSYETDKKRLNGTTIWWDGKSTVPVYGDMAFIDAPHGGKNREFSYRSVANSQVPIVACHDMHRAEDRVWLNKYLSDWKPLIGTNHLLILQKGGGTWNCMQFKTTKESF